MIALGLLLIVAAAGAATIALTAPSATSPAFELTAIGFTVGASPLAMFLAGATSVVLLGLGFSLVSRGTRRKARARKELRELRQGQATAAAKASDDTGEDPRNDTSNDTSNDTRIDTNGDRSIDTRSDQRAEPETGRHRDPPLSP